MESDSDCFEHAADPDRMRTILTDVQFSRSVPALMKHFETDTDFRNVYIITVKRGDTTISFKFGDSIHNTQNGKIVSLYSVLCCIAMDFHCPEGYEDFCSEFGYDTDSRTAFSLHKRCLIQSRKLHKIFREDEIQCFPS